MNKYDIIRPALSGLVAFILAYFLFGFDIVLSVFSVFCAVIFNIYINTFILDDKKDVEL